jgi:hypothetical protein
MTGRMMMRAMLVVAATAMILVGLTACGGGSAQEQAKPRILPEDEKALRPGEYRSEEFEPSLSFRVGKDWSHVPLEAPDVLHIERKSLGADPTAGWLWLAFINVQQVFKPGTQGQIVEAPKDMVGWYQHHPYLQTSKPEPISVGGVKGVQFDVVVEDLPKDSWGHCGEDCVDLFRTNFPNGPYLTNGLWWKDKQRAIVLEGVKGETVTITYTFPAREFDEMAPEAQRVIDSVKWTGS